MRIGRVLTIPAIVTLALAGWTLAGTVAPATAAHVNTVHVVAQGPIVKSGIYYHT
jgi:hypothetical protein